uniref:Uncharacterized protein n=1 Tax=Hyalomma excavatum TaxID=257692 RepID=A0A131XKK6_9ACAR
MFLRRGSPLPCAYKTALAVIIVSINGILASRSATSHSVGALLAQDAEIPLPDQHFDVTVTEGGEETVYSLNLTGGVLHTRGTTAKPGPCELDSKTEIAVTCHVTSADWYATYGGSIYGETKSQEELCASDFNVTITITKYNASDEPAGITVHVEEIRDPLGLEVRTVLKDYAFVVATTPPFAELSIFGGNKNLADEVKKAFEERISNAAKNEMKTALQDKYSGYIKSQINIEN